MAGSELQSFWEYYNQSKSPIEAILARKTPPREVASFVAGTEAIFGVVEQVNPGVIFLPERGASPIGWALEEWETSKGLSYTKVSLPIGSWTNVEDGKLHGISDEQKRDVIFDELKRLHDKGATSEDPIGVENPLLIDEVQSGSTIATAARLLRAGLREIYDCDRLYVIAAQDSREPALHRDKVVFYQKLVANMKEGYQVAVIPVPLFFMDRETLLNRLILPTDAPNVTKQHRLQHIMHNVEAQELIRHLVIGFRRPEALLSTVETIRSGHSDLELPPDQGLHKWITEMISAEGRYRPEHVFSWLERFARVVIGQRASRTASGDIS